MIENAKYAGMFRRVLSWIIDIWIIFLPTGLVYGLFDKVGDIVLLGLLAIYMIMAVPTLICLNDYLFEIAQNMKFKMRFLTLCKYVAFLIIGALIIAPVGYCISFLLHLNENLNMAKVLVGSTGILFFIYVPMLESSKYQGTIGKMIMRIKIVDLEGNRISPCRSFCRLIVYLVFCALHLYIISFFTILFTKEKKGLHDMACKTRIILR